MKFHILAVALLILVPTFAQADILPNTNKFKSDPRNVEGENWEGPHVPEIMTEGDWKKVIAKSKEAPVFVFKHSTECPVSAGAAYRTNTFISKEATKDTPNFYFVKVIERKPVSKTIEASTKVKHESPQLLLLKDGKVLWNTSHEKITADSIKKAVAQNVEVGLD
ncbi:MAG: bacillithiol system redox-active protein YtxJ [Candidatus Hydrogenedentota bacterium]